MKQQINRLPIQRPICRLARQLTALQLLCYSQTYAQRRDAQVKDQDSGTGDTFVDIP